MRSLALASIIALAPAAVMAASLGVPLNQSVLVSLPVPAHNIFLGNPAVADVALSDPRHVVVTGKTGGVTNLIVTDDRGRTIYNKEVVVRLSSGDRVELVNGVSIINYACAPTCEQVGSTAGAAPAAPTTTTSMSTFTISQGGAAPAASVSR
jgi:hypothetical protein